MTFVTLLLFPFLPASNIFFPVGTFIAERLLYLPSVGFSAILPIVLLQIDNLIAGPKKRINLSLVLIVLTASLFIARCRLRNEDWQTEETLFLAANVCEALPTTILTQ